MRTFTKHSVMVRGTFKGLYTWGEGWDYTTRDKWEAYLSRMKSYGWKYYKCDDGFSVSYYLHNTNNIIFLHPMQFEAVLNDCGCMVNGSYFKGDIENLYEICKGLAEYCGGTFSMEVSGEKQTTYDVCEKTFEVEEA